MNIIETENLSYKYDESHFALSDLSIGFEKAYALQTDLNLNSAEIIATYVYKKGLLDGDYSFSTAVGLFNTVINVILLIAVNKVVAKMNDGQGL